MGKLERRLHLGTSKYSSTQAQGKQARDRRAEAVCSRCLSSIGCRQPSRWSLVCVRGREKKWPGMAIEPCIGGSRGRRCRWQPVRMRLLCHSGSALCLLRLTPEEVDPAFDRPFIPNIEAPCLQCFQSVDPESLPIFKPEWLALSKGLYPTSFVNPTLSPFICRNNIEMRLTKVFSIVGRRQPGCIR